MKRNGRICTPQTAAGILAMPMSRPLTQADLEPVALPVLLRRLLSKRTVNGTLLLEAGKVKLTMDLAAGTGALEKNGHGELMKIFEIEEGTWELRTERDESMTRKAYSLPRLALDGTRRMLRQLQPEGLGEALADKLPLTPTLKPEKRALPNRMGLNSRELRFLEMHMDGSNNAHHIVQYGGLGKATALQLLALLELFDILNWEQPRVKQERPLAERLADLAHELERKTHFEVIGVHWSAPEEELQARYVAQRDAYRQGSANDKAAPQVCAQIRQRIELAFDNLNSAAKRAAYPKVALEGFDFEAVTDLAEKRSASLAMRGESKAAANSEETAKELSKSIDKSRAGGFERTMAELERRTRKSVSDTPPKSDDGASGDENP